MIFKLMEAVGGRWRRLNGAHLVALVGAGAEFRNGELVEGSRERVAARPERPIHKFRRSQSRPT